MLLVGAIAAALGTAGVLALGGGGGPEAVTPRGTVEAYLTTALRGDYAANWDLMCRDEQRGQGPRERYIDRLADSFDVKDRSDLFSVDVRGVRSAEPPHDDGFVVELLFSHRSGSAFFEEALVVWEDDGFRVCGTP